MIKILSQECRQTQAGSIFKHPREKLCAGGMLNDGDYILERLGLNCSEVPHVEVSEARFQFEGKGISIKRDPQSFKVFRRREFDHWLVIEARKRGIRIEEETKTRFLLQEFYW